MTSNLRGLFDRAPEFQAVIDDGNVKHVMIQPSGRFEYVKLGRHRLGTAEIDASLLAELRQREVDDDVDQRDREATNEFVVVDTCPGAGACKLFCYAMKGSYIQYTATSMKLAKNLNFLLNDPDGFVRQLSLELNKAIKKFSKIPGVDIKLRWHDAGDFFSPQYLDLAFGVARSFPNITFYAYTKIASAAHSSMPPNFLINFSAGAKPSEQGQMDLTKKKHSDVVPKDMFFDLIARNGNKLIKDEQGRTQFADAASVIKFKQRLAQKYSLNLDTILTYDEMMKKPVTKDM